jgi:hypothetical protein
MSYLPIEEFLRLIRIAQVTATGITPIDVPFASALTCFYGLKTAASAFAISLRIIQTSQTAA